jgi:hypothetical protein
MTDIVERLRLRRDPLTDGERAEAADEIERLRAALRSSCDEQRQLFRDEANLPCEAAIENQVMRDLLSEALDKPFTLGRQSTIDAWQCDWSRRVREALGDGVRQSNKSTT